MMKLLLGAAIGASFVVSAASAQSVYVKPHVRSDGTFVQGHNRTAPNETIRDNYSTSPNYNPYTGKRGTVDPYAPPHLSSEERRVGKECGSTCRSSGWHKHSKKKKKTTH